MANFTFGGGSGGFDPFENIKCPPENIWFLYFLPDSLVAELFLDGSQVIIVTVFFPIIFSLGFIGNTIFLLVVCFYKQMRTTTNFYLSNLAVADILFIISSAIVGFWRYGASHGISLSQPFRNIFGCLSSIAVVYFTYLSSMIIVILVSVERYLAICHPVKYRSMKASKKRIGFTMAAATWSVALCIAFVISPFQGKLTKICIVWPPGELYQNLPMEIYICEPLSEIYKDVMAFAQVLPFCISVTIIIILYTRIILALKSHKVGDRGSNQQPASVRNIQQQVTRMVILNGLVYFICLAPYQMIYILDMIWRMKGNNLFWNDWAVTLLLISRCMSALNSAINPMIYALANPKYRRAFVRFVRCSVGKIDAIDATSAIDTSDENRFTA